MTEMVLKPCPFCGQSDDLHLLDYKLWCRSCGAKGPTKIDGEPANLFFAWNTRAAPSSPVREGVREKVARIILDAVYEGFEHGQCDKEWEPPYGKEIAGLAADAILALLSTGEAK